MRLKFSASYKKDFQSAESTGMNLSMFVPPIFMLLNDQPLPAIYKDHSLGGNWAEHRYFYVKSDWLVIYRIEGDDVLVLVRTGTHAALFKK
jgi:mRNA interferase YafQ